MRPTRAGWTMAVLGVGLIGAGRIFGSLELVVLGTMALAALLVAVIAATLRPITLSVSRTVTPVRLRVGTPSRVDLVLTNTGRRATPVIRLRDQVEDTGAAALMLAPVPGGGSAEVAYRLPARRRGHLSVGPLDLTVEDPLGITRSVLRASRSITLTVHARLVDLPPLRAHAGWDPTADLQPDRAIASSGDEFFALRPYIVGDELRRVHWRASARTGELVVRQEERPRTGRVTVLLDRNRPVYSDDGFERAVTAALSALVAAWTGEDALRFATSGTNGFVDIRSRGDLDAVDEQLALVRTTDSASLVQSMDHIARVGHGGTLVVVTGRAINGLAAAVESARRSFSSVITVCCEVPAESDDVPAGAAVVGPDTDLAEEWSRATVRTPVGRTR